MGRISVPLQDDLPSTADVVIIGAGIAGVCTAFFCSRLGLRTVVVEKRDGIGTLTTARSTECFRAQFENPADIALMRGSIGMFKNLAEIVGIPEVSICLQPRGYLYATTDSQQANEYKRIVQAQHRMGLTDVELLSGDETRARFPYIAPGVIAARYRAGDGWLSVHELLHAFAKGSTAETLLKTTATGIAVDQQGVSAVETSRGTIATRGVVIAAGPFSARVAQMAQVDLPLTLLRRHRLAVLECDLVPRDAPFTMDDDTGTYWRPEGAGALMGRAFEDEPEEPAEVVAVDWAFPAMVLDPASPWNAGCLSPFWNRAKEYLHRANLDLSAGQYTYSPDHVPLIGPCPTVPGLYVNTAYSGHGIMGAPEGGRRLSLLLAGDASDADNPFSLVRLSGRSTELKATERVY